MKKLEVVNFLRGFSIFTIVLMHIVQSYNLPSILMKASSLGGAGVHVFILCSGFGLYLSNTFKKLSYFQFLKRRFSKVYIPYIIVVLISALYYGICCNQNVLMPLLGSVFLFKMFVPSLEAAFGIQMWFISTIIQFYIFFPLIVRLFNKKWGGRIALLISLSWATFITLMGLNEERIWNSFFLQYLWEFVLGMWLAKYYYNNGKLEIPSFKILIPICILGLGLTGALGIIGGFLKSYNDVFSLIGYTSLLLIIYKFRIKYVNVFFEYTNKISYEWYLLHILVFDIYFKYFQSYTTAYCSIPILLLVSYFTAIVFNKLIKTF